MKKNKPQWYLKVVDVPNNKQKRFEEYSKIQTLLFKSKGEAIKAQNQFKKESVCVLDIGMARASE